MFVPIKLTDSSSHPTWLEAEKDNPVVDIDWVQWSAYRLPRGQPFGSLTCLTRITAQNSNSVMVFTVQKKKTEKKNQRNGNRNYVTEKNGSQYPGTRRALETRVV